MGKIPFSVFVGSVCCLGGIALGLLLDSGKNLWTPVENVAGNEQMDERRSNSAEVLRMLATTRPTTWLIEGRDVLKEWAGRDPQGLIAFLEAADIPNHAKSSATMLAFESLVAGGKHSIDELFSLALSLPLELRAAAVVPLYQQGNAGLPISDRWKWIDQQQDGLEIIHKHAAFVYLTENVSNNDLDSLKPLVLSAPEAIRPNLTQTLMQRLIAKDPVSAFKWALSDSTRNTKGCEHLMEIPVLEAPESLFKEVMEVRNSSLREELLRMLVFQSSTLQVSQLKEIVEKDLNLTDPAFLQQLLSKTFEGDPDGVLEWGEAVPFGKNRDHTLRTIAKLLASKDPLRAVAWVDQLPNDHSKFLAFQEVTREQARHDPRMALDALEAIGDPRRRDEMEELVAFEWGHKEPDEALAWAGAWQDEKKKAKLEYVALKGVLRRSTDEFARVAHALLDKRDPATESPELGALLADVALQDGAAVDSILDRYRKHIGHSTALDKIVVKTAVTKISSDVRAASQWLSELPPGLPRDQSISFLVRRLAEVEPDSARAWALDINDPEIRGKMLDVVDEK